MNKLIVWLVVGIMIGFMAPSVYTRIWNWWHDRKVKQQAEKMRRWRRP